MTSFKPVDPRSWEEIFEHGGKRTQLAGVDMEETNVEVMVADSSMSSDAAPTELEGLRGDTQHL